MEHQKRGADSGMTRISSEKERTCLTVGLKQLEASVLHGAELALRLDDEVGPGEGRPKRALGFHGRLCTPEPTPQTNRKKDGHTYCTPFFGVARIWHLAFSFFLLFSLVCPFLLAR